MTSHDTSRRRRSIVVALSIGFASLAPVAGSVAADPIAASDGAVLAWNAIAGEAALAGCLAPTNNPLHESRMYAMAHLAIHDALNAIDRRSEPYAFYGRAQQGASVAAAAVAAAAHDVLVPVLLELPSPPLPPECGPNGAAVVEAAYDAALAAIPNGKAEQRGLAVGRRAAAAILSLRADDGSDTPLIVDDLPQGTEPGEYRHTPGTPFRFAPGWADVTPFALRDSSQYRARPVDGKRSARHPGCGPDRGR